MDKEKEKQQAAEAAVELVKDGMTIGMGTGSTARYAVLKLGQLVKQGFKVQAVPTSEWTRKLCLEEGVPLTDFSKVTRLDLTMDGADEMDAALNLTKGGGGALFREKIVATASDTMIVFADSSKLVKHLGAFPLPVEINPFGWQVAAQKIAALGCKATLRQKEGQPFVSDNHGYILDCAFGTIQDPPALEKELKKICGVMETGLFINIAKMALLGSPNGVQTVHPK